MSYTQENTIFQIICIILPCLSVLE
jgi:hypothetical protein